MKQALKAGKITTCDETKIKELLDHVGSMVKEIDLEDIPPEIGAKIYKKIHEITGVKDPYEEIKQSNIKEALKLYPELKEIVKKSKDPLLTAVKIAIAGNVIDLGVNKEFNITKDVKKILKQDFAICDFNEFKEKFEIAKSILYLGDNSGEGVFDRILIETMNKPVTYVVRDIPIINDITFKEVGVIGIDKVVTEVISSGTTAPATVLNLCNEEFIKRFDEAEMVISKGQGNYEGLSEVKRSIFFLLKVKCSVIADHIGVSEDDIVLKAINLRA